MLGRTESCHYFWGMSTYKHPDAPENIEEVISQTAYTFDEDRVVIEAQYANMVKFGGPGSWLDIDVDAGANCARRVVESLVAKQWQPVGATAATAAVC